MKDTPLEYYKEEEESDSHYLDGGRKKTDEFKKECYSGFSLSNEEE